MREQQTWQRKLDEVRRTAVRSKNRISREGPLLDGYLYVARVRCGRANCKCRRRDYRHELWCLSFREQGRSRTVTVPAAWRPRVAKAAGDYREARRLLRELQTQVREAPAELATAVGDHERAPQARWSAVAVVLVLWYWAFMNRSMPFCQLLYRCWHLVVALAEKGAVALPDGPSRPRRSVKPGRQWAWPPSKTSWSWPPSGPNGNWESCSVTADCGCRRWTRRI